MITMVTGDFYLLHKTGLAKAHRPVMGNLMCSHGGMLRWKGGGIFQEKEEWQPLALMVAQFEASTPARFNHGPRAVQYVPPQLHDPHEKPKVQPNALKPAHAGDFLRRCTSSVKPFVCS